MHQRGVCAADITRRSGFAEKGDLFGEMALADTSVDRTETATAGHAGAGLLVIDRAMYHHYASGSAAAPNGQRGHIAASLRALCCHRALRVAPAERTPHDVHLLVTLLRDLEVCCTRVALVRIERSLAPPAACSAQGWCRLHEGVDGRCWRGAVAARVQAFRALPHAVLRRVCRGVELQRAAPGGVVCEEDEAADAMYVVLAGACTVRAAAPPARPRGGGSVCPGASVAASMALTHSKPLRKRAVVVAPEEQVLGSSHGRNHAPTLMCFEESCDVPTVASWRLNFSIAMRNTPPT